MPRSRATRAFAMPVLTSRIASSLNSWVYLRRSCVSPFSMKHLPVDHRTLRRYPGNWGKPKKRPSTGRFQSKVADRPEPVIQDGHTRPEGGHFVVATTGTTAYSGRPGKAARKRNLYLSGAHDFAG